MKALVVYLAQLDPNLPWAALSLAVFASIYLVRRYLPTVWLSFEGLVPGGLAYPDMTKVHTVWRKVWQTLPSVALGAVIPTLASGGDVKLALYGAIAGAVAPLIHELAAALPFVPYQGKVGGPGSKRPPDDPPGGDQTPVAAKPIPVVLPRGPGLSMLALAFVLAGCGMFGSGEPVESCDAKAAAVAKVRCDAYALEKCGDFEEDPSACPDADDVDAHCERVAREELAKCN